ncbi:aminoglycoside phosphotransferase family protein, partial [Escherichia coli]|uniref:aminoglycoside phosphotransferase family protein n=1 Tax=Escherichia coli TaxID=562 RepID=UPI0030076E5B
PSAKGDDKFITTDYLQQCHPRRIAQMADAFSRALDVDPRRLLDQAYAYGCLSAAWNADGEEEQRDLAIAAAIKQVRQTSY